MSMQDENIFQSMWTIKYIINDVQDWLYKQRNNHLNMFEKYISLLNSVFTKE